MEERLLATDLYKYLILLSSLLEKVSEVEAAKQVQHISKFISGSTSELYSETRLLLPHILQSHGSKLPELDRARLRNVIAGIEWELNHIGGG